MEKLKIKEKDVFRVRYTEEEHKKNSQLNHCFEGLLVAKKINNEMILCDTYWGIGDCSGRKFKIDDIEKRINIEYYCNLNEIEPKSEPEKYYDDKDVIILTRQHACVESCRYYYIKKGAKRSKKKMLSVANSEIEKAERNIRWAKSDIENTNKIIEKINTGKLEDIYL